MESINVKYCTENYNNCIQEKGIQEKGIQEKGIQEKGIQEKNNKKIECLKEYNRCSTNFLKLPVDIQIIILSELSFRDVKKLCKLLLNNSIACHKDALWVKLINRDFEISESEIYEYYNKYYNTYKLHNLRDYYLNLRDHYSGSINRILISAINKDREDIFLSVIRKINDITLQSESHYILRLTLDNKKDNSNMVKFILDKYIQLKQINNISLSKYLIRAATNGNLNIVRLIVENYKQYMDPEKYYRDLNLSLRGASFSQKDNVADYLIEIGADPGQRIMTMKIE